MNTSWSGTRTTVPAATRRRILARDAHTCQACGGARCGNRNLEIDHRVPASEGGTNDDRNLHALGAHPCHTEKTAAERRRGIARRSTRRPTDPHPGYK